MNTLNPEQQRRALELLWEYDAAAIGGDGMTPRARCERADQARVSLIDQTLLPLVKSYLTGATGLEEFKTKVDGINKRNEFWGFKGIKGQMFFNMVVNVAATIDECDNEIKAAIALPTNDEMAKSRIRTFASYVRRLGDQFVESGGSKHGRPKVGSVPFFLSYFWQIQNRDKWPVYYTNTVQTLADANLWSPKDDLADDYVDYVRLHVELAELFSREAGRPFSLYDVEHVFWVKGGNPYGKSKPATPPEIDSGLVETIDQVVAPSPLERLPDSYVPPIVAVMPRLALGDPQIEKAAVESGTSVARAFEKCINAAFTMLGYETKLLGQRASSTPRA